VARKVAGDLKGLLEGRGFTVRRDVLYEAVAASVLPKQLLAALGSGKLDVATFFSPRTAEIFVTLVRDADLESGCTRTVALALSEAVADKLRVLSWAGVVVAERPNEEALIARLDSIAS
jgi:uroporphyrinogen-III synthase